MRRRTLLLGTTTAVTGLAGCSVLSSSSPMLSLSAFNHTDSPYTIEISFFRSGDGASRSEARAYDATIDVEPQGQARRAEIADARPYLVRYSVYEDDQRLTDEDHVHYYPPDDGDDDLAFDVDSPGVLTRR